MSTKRILSLVLALVMVLGTFGTLVSAEAEATMDPKVQWLIDQGLLQGDGSGNYDLELPVTRAVLARIVAVALEDEASALALQGSPSGFADMTTAHWANGYASYANAKGFMIGDENRNFMPEKNVTYAEALVVLTKIAMKGDLTAAEKANALTWYAPYVAKANELGLTVGTAIADVSAPAVKNDILVMLYNVLNDAKYGNYHVIKAIVLENDRISRIGEKEVTVEVIKEVQRANFVSETRKDLKGEQYTYELPEKVNAEDLLGKVIDLSINKEGKVVEVKVDKTYEVLTGAVSGISSSRLTINRKQYIVDLKERYDGNDERVYRTYLNDKDYQYADFAKDNEEVEYARVTVKAGKVLFIDAYNFDDIMPVKEVKEVKGKDTILSYDDVRNGNLIETTVSKARVILVNDETFTRGTLEDVKADNVLHTYKVGNTTKFVVLQDEAVEGKLERIKEDKDGFYVVVDGEEYTIPEDSPKEAVYEYETDSKFYTLTAKDAYKELDNFRGEEVRLLLALSEDLQYIGTNKEFGEFMGVATRIVGKEMRVLTPENKAKDYTSNLDTAVKSVGSTAHQSLNSIPKDSLVYVNADGELLKVVQSFQTRKGVASFPSVRDLNGNRITDDTVVYVVTARGASVRKIADVKKAYDLLSAEKQAEVEVSFITEVEYNEASVRGFKMPMKNHMHTVVFYGLEIQPEQKLPVYGKLVEYNDKQASGSSRITLDFTDGSRRTFTLNVDNESSIVFTEGHIYKIFESKEKEDVAVVVDKVIFKNGTVENIKNYLYKFDNGDEVYETRNTELFGARPRKDSKVSYSLVGNEMVVIVNPAYKDVDEVTPPTTTGVVTYTAGTTATVEAGTALALDVQFNNTTGANVSVAAGKVTGVIVDKDGASVPVTGLTATAFTALKGKTVGLGTITNSIANVGTYTIIVTVEESATVKYEAELTLTVKAVTADADAAKIVVDEIAALGATPTKAAVTSANTKYTALSANGKALVTNYATLKAFTDDIAAGGTVAGMALTTNKEVKDARTAYNKLGALGKAEVTVANIDAAELALANAKTAFANAKAAAKPVYTTESGRLASFTAIEITAITAEKSTEPMAYNTLVTTLGTAITTADAFNAEADAATAATIGAATTAITTATSDVTTAKAVFDVLNSVIATGK